MKQIKITPADLKHYATYIVLVSISLGTIIAGILFLPSLLQTVLSKNEQLEALSAESRSLTRGMTVLDSIDTTVLDTYLQKVTVALPDEKKTSGVITGLDTIGLNSQVTIDRLVFSPGIISTSAAELAQDNNVEKLPLGIKGTTASLVSSGTPESLTRFLSNLRNAKQMLGVQQVSLSEKNDQGMTADIGLIIFYQPPPTGPIKWDELRPLSAEETTLIDGLATTDIFTPR